ncbi:WW domain-containing protein tag-325-like [Toxorhynchites rutilus septentrionalis]|uniref:WW domain-containing protein tag-325-like n=1 Tax=Toxorhynchites rutilus septentrionalis TaxID=329112 RepID=UPI00247A4EEC|nr:WW domain-containing protein tag-325-like [Toxorhynchites rutilus septentrionalis]
MDSIDLRGTLGLAQAKTRPKNIFDGFTNRSATVKRTRQQKYVTRESKSVAGSAVGISLVDQFGYLQIQHRELIDKYNELERSHKNVENRCVQLATENTQLRESYDELQDSYNNLLGSQKSFNAGKLFVYLKLKRRTDKETLVQRNIIKNEACFNTNLVDVIFHETLGIPKIIVECVTIVESSDKFMKSVGLYRVSGNHNTIQNLRYDINADNYKKLRKQKTPHEVCGILKLFLRELKDPIIPLKPLNQIIPGPSDMIHQRSLKVLELINSLDETRKSILRYLMRHLKRVAAIKENEMDSVGLGILMSSCIFNETLTDVCPERFETICAVPRECVITMIDNYEEIFGK